MRALLYVDGVPQPARLVRHGGLLVRRGHAPDVGVIKEYPPTYRRMIHAVAGHRFMDCGANIGVFAVRALEHGAASGVCYEPEPGALTVLRANVARLPVHVVAAAVGVSDQPVVLHVPRSGNSVTASTAWGARGRRALPVPCREFYGAVEAELATLVKLDIEAAELAFLDGRKMPAAVRVVCGELHRERGSEQRCREIIESFAGWREIHAPASYSYARCYTVAWER